MGKLDGKVAIITGAARGIGAAASRLFVAEGAKVMLADVLADNLQGLATELGDSVAICQTDVTDEAQVENLVAQTIAKFGKLNVALFNAGIEGSLAHPTEYDTDMFDKVMAVNVRGVFLGLKHTMAHMKENGGSIVITASTAGIRGVPGMAAYAASKHAAMGLMRSAAMDGAPDNIRINTVNPSPIDTPMMASLENMHGVTGQTTDRSPARHPWAAMASQRKWRA